LDKHDVDFYINERTQKLMIRAEIKGATIRPWDDCLVVSVLVLIGVEFSRGPAGAIDA
jgi:hypothetical protein